MSEFSCNYNNVILVCSVDSELEINVVFSSVSDIDKVTCKVEDFCELAASNTSTQKCSRNKKM